MLTDEVAVREPKYGEEDALKLWTVPPETIARGPLAENVWLVPERALSEVMPETPLEMHVLFTEKHPPVRLTPLAKVEEAVELIRLSMLALKPPCNVEVAVDVAKICPKLGEEDAFVVKV